MCQRTPASTAGQFQAGNRPILVQILYAAALFGCDEPTVIKAKINK